MGQKVNPISLRVSIIRSWDSLWYAQGKDYVKYLHEDRQIRKLINNKIPSAGISKIKIERLAKNIKIGIYAMRTGVALGKKGEDIQNLKKAIEKIVNCEVSLNVHEIKRPDSNAALIAQNVSQQIENRASHKKAMKKAIQAALKAGAKGVKINVSGRIGGAEIARSEHDRAGRVPLHTLRADISYGFHEAKTPYGIIGVKAWSYLGNRSKIEY